MLMRSGTNLGSTMTLHATLPGGLFKSAQKPPRTRPWEDPNPRRLSERLREVYGTAPPSEARVSVEPSPPIEVRPVNDPRSTPNLRLESFSVIEPVPVPWIWKNRFARSMMTPLVGDGGCGKGYICLDCIARLSRGNVMPDGSSNPFGGPRSSIILESEDAPEYTLRPRLDQQGADLTRVHFLRVKNNGTFDISRHLRELTALVLDDPEIVFLMISAVNDFLPPNVKTGLDSEVRRLVLNPLGAFVQETELTAIGIHHIGKATDRRAHHRTLDSVAYYNKPRVMLGAVVTQHEDGGPTVGELGGLKNNIGVLAPNLGYEITDQGLRWTGPTGSKMKELFESEFKVTDKGPSKVTVAEGFLLEILKNGPVDKAEIDRAAGRAGISERTLRRAQENLVVSTVTSPIGRGRGKVSQWALPQDWTKGIDLSFLPDGAPR